MSFHLNFDQGKRGTMVDMVMNALPCKDCGLTFERLKQRGRPPIRCQECRDRQVTDQQVVVDLVDPETLYDGPKEALLGSRDHKPQGGEAQCPLVNCGRVFTSNSACEAHKSYPDGKAVCVDPATIGMVPKERRGIPVWVRPSDRIFE